MYLLCRLKRTALPLVSRINREALQEVARHVSRKAGSGDVTPLRVADAKSYVAYCHRRFTGDNVFSHLERRKT